MDPIHVDVFMPLPEGWGICLSCEMLIAEAKLDKAPFERGLDEYPPEWREDLTRFSDTLLDLSMRYGDAVRFLIYDPRSLQGLIRAIRFGVHRYPTFIVQGKKKVVGYDLESLEQAVLKAGFQPPSESSEGVAHR